MHIVRDRTKKLLCLSKEKYVTKVIQRFNMPDAKLVRSTLPTICKLSRKQSPKTKVDKGEMMKITYASAVRSLMYAMVGMWSAIGYAVGHRICSRSGQLVHEQSVKRALGCRQVDTSIPERHLESVLMIWFR